MCYINVLRYSLIKDLGILFNSKLLFNSQILAIKNKTSAIFGLIKQNSSEFNDPHTFKYLYTSLIRSNLEYAPLIWDSNSIEHSNELENIQKKILRFIYYKY